VSIDVVIPVYNGWELTRTCLQHLAAQSREHRVIVADNGSTDGTQERMRAEFPAAGIVALGTNAGFAVACNAGARAGTGEIVVLLNNDVECPPTFLERLVEPLTRDDGVGSAAALLVSPDGTIESFGVTVDPVLAGYPRLRGRPLEDADAARPLLVGPSGAAGAYRRPAWDEIGGLDEGVFAYGEDIDLALRLRAAGWSAAAAPAAVAVHLGSATAVVRSPRQRFQGGFSRGYFMRRYGVLHGRRMPRALATEAIAVAGDALIYSHDLAALRGRVAGWRVAASRPRNPRPPDDAVDRSITFLESLRLRRNVYRCT
jgi:N-acetylglucosaminyl-diphospho-decaprenol L-rhamnosyltransferase